MECPHCGETLPEDAERCHKCHTELLFEDMEVDGIETGKKDNVSQERDKINSPASRVCPKCGELLYLGRTNTWLIIFATLFGIAEIIWAIWSGLFILIVAGLAFLWVAFYRSQRVEFVCKQCGYQRSVLKPEADERNGRNSGDNGSHSLVRPCPDCGHEMSPDKRILLIKWYLIVAGILVTVAMGVFCIVDLEFIFLAGLIGGLGMFFFGYYLRRRRDWICRNCGTRESEWTK